MATPLSAESSRPPVEEANDPFAPDLGLQLYFDRSLEHVRKDTVHVLPNLKPLLNHDGQISTGLDEQIGPGVYVKHDFLNWCQDTGHGLPDRLSFTVDPLMRVGRENSRRKVFFGFVGLLWFSDHGRREDLRVAVTPAPGQQGYEVMLHEIAVYQYFEELGIPSFEVLALLSQPENKVAPAFLITRYKPNIDTMDNLMWEAMPMQMRREQVGKALDTLITLHSRLLFQGDTHFRNIAAGEVKGDITIIDPEFTKSALDLVDPSKPMGHQRLCQLLSQELREFAEDFDAFITKYLPSDEKPTDDIERFELHLREVYMPYYDRLVHADTPHRAALLRALNDVIQQKTRQANGEW